MIFVYPFLELTEVNKKLSIEIRKTGLILIDYDLVHRFARGSSLHYRKLFIRLSSEIKTFVYI